MVKELREQWGIGILTVLGAWIDAFRAFVTDMGMVIAAGAKIARARFLPTLRSLNDLVEAHADATKLAIVLPLVCFVMFGVWVTILFTTGI